MEPQKPHARTPHFKTRMASGLVVLIPLVVTIAVIRFVFTFTSGILLPIVDPAVGSWPPVLRAALSFGVLLVMVYVLGSVATNIVGRRVLAIGEGIVLRVPFIKVIYSISKQVVAAFQGEQARAFKSVVLVGFPHPGMRAIGFVTSTFERDDGSIWHMVFVPTTPNPTTGFLQLMPQSDVESTSYSVEDGVKMIMSLGVLNPERELVPPA